MENTPQNGIVSARLRLPEIYNFRLLGEQLGTSGQPIEAQFQTIRQAGFDVVINLALPTSDNAVPDEGSIVTGLGMAYVHIPVNFQKPASEDFQTFCQLMDAFEGRNVFVHCAANMRVSSFVFLYRVLRKGMEPSRAEQDLRAIWEPDEIWTQFMQKELGSGPA
jgi:protein tyrosine phosphatase (PTP) superfamily phosphohydrolase (DUF442 family)